MSIKTKNTRTTTDKLTEAAQNTGVVLMTALITLGLLEMPEHAKRVIVPQTPVPELVGNSEQTNPGHSLRREREETGPHYVSYSVTQRTPGRTGRA
ncbi:MAG TPA: hypothetical protein VFX84_03310 [Candidatus Saccharimonadales bacterium]|nr:hypothetical protein [Candidatus Saccharimonadales bacterium]